MRVYASAEMTLTDTNDGISVTGIDRYYMASSSSSGITVGSQGWKPDPQETNPVSRYHWSYEVVNYSDGAKIPSKPAVIGVYGKEGKEGVDAVTVSLSSEAHTFAGTESKATASSITIDIYAFKGSQRIPTSIGTVTGGISGQLTHSELGRGTTNNKLVINATSALGKGNGTLSIPIVADGRTFNKVFSWSVAFKGKTGDKGDTGSILGENQWIGHKYSYPGSTRIYPSFDHIQGLNPIATEILDDSTRFTFNDDYYIAHFQTNLYVSLDKQITTTVSHDDNLTIYCDGEIVVSKNATASVPYNITFNLKAGWNKIDVLLHEMAGGDHVSFGTKLSSLVEHLTYIKGSDGVSIAKVDVQYYLSTSSTALAGGRWSTTAPDWEDGRFMWSKTVTTYTSGPPTESKPVCITGAKGSTGGTGATGRGVSSVVEQFYLSDSKTVQPPTSGWSTNMPTWSPGKYIWTRSLITYTTGTPATSTTEPLVSSEWEAINELEIGVRNLLRNSNFTDEFTYWLGSGTRELIPDNVFGSVAKVTTTSTTGIIQKPTKELIVGKEYTLSTYVKAENTSQTVYLAIDGNGVGAAKSHRVSNEWTKISSVFTFSGVNLNIRIYTVGVLYVANVKLEEGNKATDWSPAPEDVATSIKAAQDKANVASQEAIAAQADATVGKNMADNLSNDSVITQVEKLELKREWDAIVKEKPSITIQATDYALQGSTEATNYNAAYTALNNLIPGLLANMKVTSAVARSTFNTNFANYYDRRQLLLNRIAKKAKELADVAQSSVDNLEIGGENLFATTNTVAGYESAGNIRTSTEVHRTMNNLVDIGDTKSLIYQVWNPNRITNTSNVNRVAFFTEANVHISSVAMPQLNGSTYQMFKIDVPTNARKARLGAIMGISTIDPLIRIKFEKGNKATDWSPSPEDIEAAYTSVAQAKAEAERVIAQAYADDIVTDEEEARIKDVNAKLAAAKQHAENISKVQDIGNGDKKFINVGSLEAKPSSATGYLVIKTPLTSPYMTKMKISGYNYRTSKTNIDISVSFYAYSNNAFHNYSFISSGNYSYNKVQLARDSSGKTVVIIGNQSDTYNYPKISIDEVLVTQGTPPDSFKNGFSADIVTDISMYTNVVDIPGEDTQLSISAAQTAANNAATAASNAQSTATAASNSASTANSLLTDIASDSKLTATEKKAAKKEWDIIVGEKPKIDSSADTYSVITEKTAYNTAYNTLNNYLSGLLANLNTTSNIVGTTFRANFKAYYNARQDLLNKISDSAKSLVDEIEVGGRNLIVQQTITIGKYINASNVLVEHRDWFVTDYIPVSGYNKMTTSGYTNLGISPSVTYYDSSKNFVRGVANNNQSRAKDITINSGEAFIRFSGEIRDLPTIKLEKGNKATDWTPAPEDVEAAYTAVAQAKANAERIKAQAYADGKITAEEKKRIAEAEQVLKDAKAHALQSVKDIEIGGRNLVVRHNEIVNTYLSGSGSYPGTTQSIYPTPTSATGHSTVAEAIPVIEGEELTFTKSGNMHWRNNWLDEEYEFISRFVPTSREFTETVPAGAHYLWVSYPTDEVVQIERGNKATDWTPAPEDVQFEIDKKAGSTELNDTLTIVREEREKLGDLRTEFQSTKSNLLITHSEEWMNTITETANDIGGISNRIINIEQTKEQIDTFFKFDDALTIAKSNAQTKLRLTNDEIQFLDGETKGTYITGNNMVTQNLTIQDKLNLPNHTMESQEDLTIIRFIG